MDDRILVLIFMVFFHIVDDYYLQGWLSSAKQKSWWEKNHPETMYENDYLMALFLHCFSWTFMVTLPLTVYSYILGGVWYTNLFLVNLLVHFFTDNAKENLKKINLIQDQSIHLLQIFITWALWLYIY